MGSVLDNWNRVFFWVEILRMGIIRNKKMKIGVKEAKK